MKHVKPLPDMLADRYRAWRSHVFEKRRGAYAGLAFGQAPQIMIIGCCDSRVMISDMFAAEAGDYFVHRNIAALVPSSGGVDRAHGTLSTVEFAVTILHVRHILVVGHTGCGGVEGALDLCEGSAPRFADPASFIGVWLRGLRPAWETVRHLPDRPARLSAFERETVCLSLRNLAALPFVAEAAEAGRLSLHGALWNIGGQRLEVLHPATGGFEPLPL